MLLRNGKRTIVDIRKLREYCLNPDSPRAAHKARGFANVLGITSGFHKKAAGKPGITWPESVDEALCFGWIDGIRRRIDDESYSIRFTPRKALSAWSAVNIRRVAGLLKEGRHDCGGNENICGA